MSKNTLLIGPPGAGKGTQALYLANKFNLARIDTGTLIRQAIKENNELGQEAKLFVAEGKLIPDNLVLALIINELKQIQNKKQDFLLDGFPRNLVQADGLEEILKSNDLSLDFVLCLEMDQSKLLKRITGRRICTNKDCNAVYHLEFSVPKKDNICDLCGSILYQRDDDKQELVASRLQTYNQETLPLINFYQEKKLLKKINGDQKKELVSAAIKTTLEN